MSMIDPTQLRLSDSLLLSDLMGCDSVYRYGYRNFVRTEEEYKLREGMVLAALLEEMQSRYGPFITSYGFICQDLSTKIVKYQNPLKPSYHRWDLGAAADVTFPRRIHPDSNATSPIALVRDIHRDRHHFSRMITYSESAWICVGTKHEEVGGTPRHALYENRYVGVKKPQYISYPQGYDLRASYLNTAVLDLEHPWVGGGFPSYHGGGRQQFHHISTSEYTTRLSFLYDKFKVQRGQKNLPPLTDKELMDRWTRCSYMAGDAVDALCDRFGKRFSIIRAYNSDVEAQQWVRRFTLEIVPPVSVSLDAAAHVLSALDCVKKVGTTSKGSIQVVGEDI